MDAKAHNKLADDIVKMMVRPVLRAGGDPTEILVLLESIIVGVVSTLAKDGAEDHVLDAVVASAKKRMAEYRLKNMEPEGHG